MQVCDDFPNPKRIGGMIPVSSTTVKKADPLWTGRSPFLRDGSPLFNPTGSPLVAVAAVGSLPVCQPKSRKGKCELRAAQSAASDGAVPRRAGKSQRCVAQVVRMEIVDNGRAFSVSNLTNGSDRQSLGLLGMQERVRLVNGPFAIELVPRRGSTARVQTPARSPAAQNSAG